MCKNKDNVELKLNATGTLYVEPREVIHSESFRKMLEEISRVFDRNDKEKSSCSTEETRLRA